jgi:hypothetical protein
MIYKLYGVTIASDLKLPTSGAGEEKPSFTIEYGTCDERALPSTAFVQRSSGVRTYSRDLTRFDWKWVGRAYVCDGKRIIIDRSKEYNEFVASIGIAGMGCGVLLHQAGHLVLHSSSLANNRGAILIMGDSGMGKSTLMAEMLTRGWKFVSDDISRVESNSKETFAVSCGPPFIKLKDSIIENVLKKNPLDYNRVYPPSPKRVVTYPDVDQSKDINLRGIVILNWSVYKTESPFRILKMSETDAMKECLKHTYALPMMGSFAASRDTFVKMADLSRSVPFFSVVGDRSLAAIDAIEEKIRSILA